MLGGAIVPDPSGLSPGRGAWVHADPGCLDTALARKAFGRALRRPGAEVRGDEIRVALSARAVPGSTVPSEDDAP